MPIAKYLVAIALSFLFIVLESLMDNFSSKLPRRKGKNGNQRFHVSYLEDQAEKYLMPLNIRDLRKEMRSKKQIISVDILRPQFSEASFGIGFCVAALSGNLINYLVFPLLAEPGEYEPILHPILGVGLIFIFVMLVITTSLIREFGSHEKPWIRITSIQATNLIGLCLMIAVFLFLGELVA